MAADAVGVAALAVGKQVVNWACRLWLGEGAADDLADTVADLLADQVPDAIQRHRLAGMFEGFAATVAESAKAAGAAQFRSLPENEREAATLAVAETFQKTRLDDRTLFAANLDARAVERHLRVYVVGHHRAWGLSPRGTDYFDFLLRECCSYLLEDNRDRHGNLPRNRIELYRISLEMFLERRDNELGLRPSSVTLEYADKLRLLQELAYWMMSNGLAAAPRPRVLNRLGTALERLRHRIDADAEAVLEYLLERSGVLREPVPGSIDFVHRNFQEFLAASAIIEHDDIELLLRYARDDQWRQVVVLAAGLGRPDQADLLLHRKQAGHLLPSPTMPRAYRESTPEMDSSAFTAAAYPAHRR